MAHTVVQYVGCIRTPYASGPCEACLMQNQRGYIEGQVHMVRELVESDYGLRSDPHLYCDAHCPICAEERRPYSHDCDRCWKLCGSRACLKNHAAAA